MGRVEGLSVNYMHSIRTTLVIIVLTFSQTCFAKFIGYSFRKQCRVATEIFIGRVISIKDSTYAFSSPIFGDGTITKSTIRVKLLHTWKGQPTDTITFSVDNFVACCGNRFILDQDFIIYSTKNNVDFCSGRTYELKGHQDLRKLNFKFRRHRYKSK